MKTTTTLADLLKDIENGKNPTFEPIDKDEILQFNTNPLASVILHTELSSNLKDGYDYSEVFNDADDVHLPYNSMLLQDDLCKHEEFNETCEWADEILNYYQELIAVKRLKGMDLVPFEDCLVEILELIQENKTKVSFLPILVKLPRFYESQKKFAKIIKSLKSFEPLEEKPGRFFYWEGEIKPLSIYKKFIKSEKKKTTYYHFVTKHDNLLEYAGTKDLFLESLFKNSDFLNMKINVKVDFNPIEHPITGFIYGQVTNMEFI